MTINLKELLHKYNHNTASKEEIKLVEEKIEEFNLLQEHTLTDQMKKRRGNYSRIQSCKCCLY